MAITGHAIPGAGYSTTDITSNTNVRDVSQMLDLWAHKWTPVLNRIDWAGESGGLVAEWVSEHLGWGYLLASAAIVSASTVFLVASGTAGLTELEQMKQIQTGTMLYAKDNANVDSFMVVKTKGSSNTVTFSQLTGSGAFSTISKIYIVAHYVNEGSDPYGDISRKRTILSNKFGILRKDIRITGSQANTDMYAIGSEPSHQATLRLLEMQREREMAVILSTGQARSSANAAYIYGFWGYLNSVSSNDWVDTSATSLTESRVNDMVAVLFDNGATGPFGFIASHAHTRLFTKWDADRVRTVPDAKLGGHFISKYLTDVNEEIELIPMRKFPANMAFLIDFSNVELKPKRSRKLIMEKLAKAGDYERWQLISEYTMCMVGYDKGYHAMWDVLS